MNKIENLLNSPNMRYTLLEESKQVALKRQGYKPFVFHVPSGEFFYAKNHVEAFDALIRKMTKDRFDLVDDYTEDKHRLVLRGYQKGDDYLIYGLYDMPNRSYKRFREVTGSSQIQDVLR